MGSSKTQQYAPYQLRFAAVSKALGHAARITIIEFVSEQGHATATDFIHITQLSEATISQHVKELLSTGILTESYLGNKHFYCLNPKAEDMVKAVFQIFNGRKKGS
jgi:ArsR family transcriptional regulator, arsenate/arsenite/antimonite-responsive transcriptional repressor